MKKRQNSKINILISSAFVVGILLGCEKNDGSVDTQNTISTTQALNNKLNIYIPCYNLTKKLDEALGRYKDWVKDMRQGPTGNESYIGGLYFSGDLKKIYACKDNINKLASTAPITDLDKAAIEFIDSFMETSKIANDLSIYYERKDYKDDNFKKGKNLHKILVKAAIQYGNNADVLAEEISAANDLRQLEQLVKVEKENGRGDTYYRLSIMIQSKQLIRLLLQNDFTITKAEKLLDTYSQTIDEATDFYESPNYKAVSDWKFFIAAARSFSQSAKERFRCIRDNKTIVQKATTTGSLADLQKRYNYLVENFNH